MFKNVQITIAAAIAKTQFYTFPIEHKRDVSENLASLAYIYIYLFFIHIYIYTIIHIYIHIYTYRNPDEFANSKFVDEIPVIFWHDVIPL